MRDHRLCDISNVGNCQATDDMLVPEISVRRAGLDDVAALVVLMTAFYAESSYPLDKEWASAAFRHLLSNQSLGCAWLASAGRRAIGHAVLTARYTMEHGALTGYVDDLYVEPEFRRKGVAQAMLERLVVESRERELASLQVEVAQSNHPARALYAKFDLREVMDGRVLLTGRLHKSGG